jgi:hypothetical protein
MQSLRQRLQWGVSEVRKFGTDLDTSDWRLARGLGHVKRTQSATGTNVHPLVEAAAARAECSYIDADANDVLSHRALALEDPMQTLFPPARDMSALWALEVSQG